MNAILKFIIGFSIFRMCVGVVFLFTVFWVVDTQVIHPIHLALGGKPDKDQHLEEMTKKLEFPFEKVSLRKRSPTVYSVKNDSPARIMNPLVVCTDDRGETVSSYAVASVIPAYSTTVVYGPASTATDCKVSYVVEWGDLYRHDYDARQAYAGPDIPLKKPEFDYSQFNVRLQPSGSDSTDLNITGSFIPYADVVSFVVECFYVDDRGMMNEFKKQFQHAVKKERVAIVDEIIRLSTVARSGACH
jgi:hypothetical protein